MKEVDVGRLALLFAFAFISLVLLIVAALLIEAFGKGDDAAEWASAVGGFLAVVAAAIIAVNQSNQARESARDQAALNAASLKAQADLNAASLAAQEALQAASFEFQKSAVREAQERERTAAIGVIISAYDLIAGPMRTFSDSSGPSSAFTETWGADAELAISISKSVQYSHLSTSTDVRCISVICVLISDAWKAVQNAAEAKDDQTRFYMRALAKHKVRSIVKWLNFLDPSWVDGRFAELSFIPEEIEAGPSWVSEGAPEGSGSV